MDVWKVIHPFFDGGEFDRKNDTALFIGRIERQAEEWLTDITFHFQCYDCAAQ